MALRTCGPVSCGLWFVDMYVAGGVELWSCGPEDLRTSRPVDLSTRGPVDLWVAGFAWAVGCGQNISHAGRVRCRPMDPWTCGPGLWTVHVCSNRC